MILISHNTKKKKYLAPLGKKKGTTHLDEDDDVRDDARDRSCSEKKTRERERSIRVSAQNCSERLAKYFGSKREEREEKERQKR
jgi:hypothetical protein